MMKNPQHYDAIEELEEESSREFESELATEFETAAREEEAEKRKEWEKKLKALKEVGQSLGCLEDYGSEEIGPSKLLELPPKAQEWLEEHKADLPPDLERRPRVNGRRVYVVATDEPMFDDDPVTLEEIDDFYRFDGWPDEVDLDEHRQECLGEDDHFESSKPNGNVIREEGRGRIKTTPY